jgi:hypothetical protein
MTTLRRRVTARSARLVAFNRASCRAPTGRVENDAIEGSGGIGVAMRARVLGRGRVARARRGLLFFM